MDQLKQIGSFYQYSANLAAGGQPTQEQFSLLMQAGFEVIINISPVSTRNAIPGEHQVIENLRMDYIHYPIDCSYLRETHYLTIRALLNSLEGKKIFMHCGGNIKTSNLIHMYHVLEKKMGESNSLQTLLKIQKPEDKWFQYFKKMGMQGISHV